MPRKQVNLVIGISIIAVSILTLFFSENNSKITSPFADPNQPETSKQTGIYDEEVLGQSALVSEPPDPTQSLNETEEAESEELDGEQTDEEGFKVIKVVDGDTLDVIIDGKTERLRLIGIDTPETVDPRKEVQCFGIEASNKAKELLTNEFVNLESDETQGERDKYKRLLRYVFLPDGTNFNLYMIAEGYAHEYTYDEVYKYQSEFKQAEIEARNQNKGLWSPNTCPN